MTFAVARTITMWVVGTRARRLDGWDRPIRIGLAALSLVALAACGDDDDDDDGGRTTTTVPELELEPSTTTTTTPEDTALQDVLLDDDAVPELTRDRDEVLGLDAAAASTGDPEAERALLETRGFVRGVARRWLGPADDVVFVTAYEFADADQADLYLVDGTGTVAAQGAERVEVPDVPGAVGFRTESEGYVDHAVAFTRGTRWFLVIGSTSTGTIDAEDVQRLAAAQAALAE